MINNIKVNTGADQITPSVPQYFSWINNTNEGSTESQTLINLDFFDWLKREFGMEIKIYAWDAGNFDGAGCGYGDMNGEKFRTQYPNGYDRVVKRASDIGVRMGIWGSPDGFGDTPEEERRRFDFMVDLCRKYHFMLFKVDGVCGQLRPEKAHVFRDQLKECRKYSPDLIVLNHRLNLYEAAEYVTTSLWQGRETYVDVQSANSETCMHHRGFIFKRGLPDDLNRLLEDHGVCISSSVAYFEDDLIYQAFGRCMILSPEIYGNPWLMRDDEFPKLARIYNLHRACAPILVDGLKLPESYGDTPVSRGNASHRFITTGNHGWTPRSITLKLNDEIALSDGGEKIALIQRHPSEKLIGVFDYGASVSVELMPFRAHLFEVAVLSEAYPVLENCEYEMIREDKDGFPKEVKLLFSEGGEINVFSGGVSRPYGRAEKSDVRPFAPVYLGKLLPEELPERCREELYETAQFAIENDSLERRELNRAGESKIPEVKAARDAFFSQATYLARGCDSSALFDGNPDTFFDGQSRYMTGDKDYGIRVLGGCLRVDFGDLYDADAVEITCFDIHEPIKEVPKQIYPESGSYSSDLIKWNETKLTQKSVLDNNVTAKAVKMTVHDMVTVVGDKVRVIYELGASPIRYFRLPLPMDRIYSVCLMKDGRKIAVKSPKASNLQAPYEKKKPTSMRSVTLTLPKVKDGDYIAVAINGEHGEENAYCVAEIDGEKLGFPDRAPAYQSNVWEYRVCHIERNYTYYLPLKEAMSGKSITLRSLFTGEERGEIACEAWLCPKH